MKNLLLTTIICFSLLSAALIDDQISLKVAQNTFIKYHPSKNIEKFNIKSIDIIKNLEDPLIKIFQLNPTGFIMVSLEDKTLPVLAYGFESNFKLVDMPENLSYIINLYKNQIIDARNSNSPRSQEIESEWNSLITSNNNQIDRESSRNVSPLIDARFDQGGAWNNALTQFGFNGPVGCVAVSMAQIMHYWEYPEQGSGSNSYFEDDYGILEANFGQAFYDYDSMANTYATAASQLLLHHAGISVNMDYANSGSGAYVTGSYPSAQYALETYFLYDDGVYAVTKDSYTTSEFRNILINELDNNRPILYSGYSDTYGNGGHAWNVDGYQGNNVHCNWGWGGSNNGYFNLNTMGGFEADQTALINLIPQPYTNPLALFEYEIDDMTAIFIDLSEFVNETQISSWNWNFGDGSSISNNYSYAEHSYSNPGEYEVTLTVTNVYGQTGVAHSELIQIGAPILPGDINVDELVNILDVVMLINFVLGSVNPSNIEFSSGDYNLDGFLNVLDVVLIINLILD